MKSDLSFREGDLSKDDSLEVPKEEAKVVQNTSSVKKSLLKVLG